MATKRNTKTKSKKKTTTAKFVKAKAVKLGPLNLDKITKILKDNANSPGIVVLVKKANNEMFIVKHGHSNIIGNMLLKAAFNPAI